MTKLQAQGYRCVGKLAKPHGIKGHFILALESDFPDWVAQQSQLYALVAGSMQTWNVTSVKHLPNKLILSVDALPTRTHVEDARGTELFVTEEAARTAMGDDPDYFYNSDLVDLRVLDAELQQNYGSVISVVEAPAQNLLEVKQPSGNIFLFPFAAPLIHEINLEEGYISVSIPDGLIECNLEPVKQPKKEPPSRAD